MFDPDIRPRPRLRKADVKAGFVLWLPAWGSAKIHDPDAYLRSHLEEDACDHPVLVIDTLDPSHDFVWVVIITSKHNERQKPMPLMPKSYRNFYGADHTLFYELSNVRMNKGSFVGVNEVYEVSVAMLRQELHEPSLGWYRLDSQSLELVRKKVKPAMDELERTSHALKLCPRSSSTCSSDLQLPVPNSESEPGHTSGTTPVLSKPYSPVSSTQPSPSTSSASSELADQSASDPDTYSTSRSVADSAGGDVNQKLTFHSASQDDDVRRSSQMEPLATKPVGETPVKLSTSTGSPSDQLAVANPNMGSKSTAVPTLDSAPTSAIAARVESATVLEGYKCPEFRATGIWNFIKPGAILWNQPGVYEPNYDPTLHIKDKADRPCVVLRVCENTANIQVLNMTTLAGEPLSRVVGISATNKKYYLPIAKHGYPASLTDKSLFLANGGTMPGKRLSYVNANEILHQAPATFKVPNEGPLRLTDASFKKLTQITEEAMAVKQHAVTNTPSAPEAGVVGEQRVAKLPVPGSQGVSDSTATTTSTAGARVNASQSAMEAKGTSAGDHAGALQSTGSPSHSAGAQCKSANWALKPFPFFKTASAIQGQVKDTKAESNKRHSVAPPSVTTGTAGQDGVNGTNSHESGLAPIPVASSKSIETVVGVKNSSIMPLTAGTKAAEAWAEDGSTTTTTIKPFGSVSSPAVRLLTKPNLSLTHTSAKVHPVDTTSSLTTRKSLPGSASSTNQLPAALPAVVEQSHLQAGGEPFKTTGIRDCGIDVIITLLKLASAVAEALAGRIRSLRA